MMVIAIKNDSINAITVPIPGRRNSGDEDRRQPSGNGGYR